MEAVRAVLDAPTVAIASAMFAITCNQPTAIVSSQRFIYRSHIVKLVVDSTAQESKLLVCLGASYQASHTHAQPGSRGKHLVDLPRMIHNQEGHPDGTSTMHVMCSCQGHKSVSNVSM